MPTKIATAEDVQIELRTLLAMTEEEAPSRAKMAAAISDLANRVAGGNSLASQVGKAIEDWATVVGAAIQSKTKGLNYLYRVANEWKTITISIKGARGNVQDIIFGYDMNSVEMHTVVLGQIEGHKINGLTFRVNSFDDPKVVAEKYFAAYGRYVEENAL
jgi:hypothetical protein